jgi:ribosomal-protein-serine acetyltransferase
MFSKIVDENLELRFVSEKYAEELCSVVAQNLEHLQKWLPWATEDYSVDTAKSFIKMNLEGFAKNEFPSHFIFYDNKLTGGIGFNNVKKSDQNAEIGYWLSKESQGNGIVTKCCREVIDLGFNDLNLKRIVIKCATENIKSQAIPGRLGFVKEGIARQSAKLNGEFIDFIVYSMLKEEWD